MLNPQPDKVSIHVAKFSSVAGLQGQGGQLGLVDQDNGEGQDKNTDEMTGAADGRATVGPG